MFAMKIKIFHLAFARKGGAGNVALTLSEEMKSLNQDSTFIYSLDKQGVRNTLRKTTALLFSAIDNYIIKKNSYLPFFSVLRTTIHSKELEKHLGKNSLIHLHWIPGLVNLRKLQKSNEKNFKMVVTLHDMWFFTGGCHFSNGCDQYVTGCRQCPMVRSVFRPLVARQFLEKKDFFSVYKSAQITAPSNSLLKQASRSGVFCNQSFHLISNPISKRIVFSGSKTTARKITDFEVDTFLVGFVAASITDPRKNFKEALSAVTSLVATHPHANIKFLVIGRGMKSTLGRLPFIRAVGEIKSPELLAPFYAACDVVLVTSTEENSPLVVIEALVNNTYVIASNSGGASELIGSTKNGYIYENQKELSKTLIEIFESGKNGHKSPESQQNYYPNQIANKYLSLYETL